MSSACRSLLYNFELCYAHNSTQFKKAVAITFSNIWIVNTKIFRFNYGYLHCQNCWTMHIWSFLIFTFFLKWSTVFIPQVFNISQHWLVAYNQRLALFSINFWGISPAVLNSTAYVFIFNNDYIKNWFLKKKECDQTNRLF
jgi:hypothetical protein